MDATTLAKSIAGFGVMVCAMILALTHNINGEQAMAAISAVGAVFIGGQAVLGGARAIADGMSRTRLLAVPPKAAGDQK
jgi:hypothetical protein